jgi:hypothetical protein
MARVNRTSISVDEIDAKVLALKGAVSEGNIFLADFKSTIKEGRGLLDDIQKIIDEGVGDKVETAVANEIAKLNEATSNAIESTETAIFKRFDQLTSLLMDGTKGHRTQGGHSLEQMIESVNRQVLAGRCLSCGGIDTCPLEKCANP